MAVDLGGDAGVPELFVTGAKPFIAHRVFAGKVDHRHAPESGFFHGDGIVDQSTSDIVAWAVDATNEEHGVEGERGEWSLAFVVGVGDKPSGGKFQGAEQGEVAIDGGFIGDELSGFSLGLRGIAADAKGDTFHDGDDADF